VLAPSSPSILHTFFDLPGERRPAAWQTALEEFDELLADHKKEDLVPPHFLNDCKPFQRDLSFSLFLAFLYQTQGRSQDEVGKLHEKKEEKRATNRAGPSCFPSGPN